MKSTKLTHTLFLINPRKFLPVDIRMAGLPIFSIEAKEINPSIDNIGLSYYQQIFDTVRSNFPGCELYEINLLAYLIDSGNLIVNDTYYQTGSNIYGDSDDYIDSFFELSSVWVGGPTSGEKAMKEYPIYDPEKGDIILSHLNHVGNGIGIVLYNEYSDKNKFHSDYAIKVLWINKTIKPNSLNSTRMMGFSRAGAIKESFKNKYQETFVLINKLISMSGHMNKISEDY